MTTARHCLLALVSTLAAAAAGAAPAGLTWKADHLRVDDAHAALLAAARMGDTNVEYLLDQSEIHLDTETVTTRETSILRFHDADAIAQNGNQYIGYTEGIHTLTIETALVVLPNGEVRSVDPDTVQVIPSETRETFGDSMQVVIPMPGLQAGASIILVWELRAERERMMTRWARTFYEQYIWPKHRLEVSVTWHESQPTPSLAYLGDGLVSCDTSESLRVHCVGERIEPLLQDSDVVYRDVMAKFVIAEPQEWADVSTRLGGYMTRGRDGAPEVIELARELTENADGPAEYLDAITRFVKQDIRYVGLEHGANTHVPRRASVTLDRRYGDCKDMTVLMLDMLSAVGIEAQPVFVATQVRDTATLALPSGRFFDHVIVCGDLDGDQSFCVDATDPYSPVLGATPSTLQGAAALAAGASDVTRLPSAEFRYRMREELELSIEADGSVGERSSVHYDGEYGAFVRSSLAGLDAKEQQEWLLNDYQSTVSDLVSPTFEVDGANELKRSVDVAWETRYPELFESGRIMSYSENAAWLDQLIGFFETSNEHYSYAFSGLQYEGDIRVRVSPKWQIRNPGRAINVDTRFGSMTRRVDHSDGVIRYRVQVSLPAQQIPVDQLDAFRKFLTTLKTVNGFQVTGIEAARGT